MRTKIRIQRSRIMERRVEVDRQSAEDDYYYSNDDNDNTTNVHDNGTIIDDVYVSNMTSSIITIINNSNYIPLDPVTYPYGMVGPYEWSTSMDSKQKPPLLTSSRCAEAMTDLFRGTSRYDRNPFLLAVVVEASSHPTGIEALYAQPYVYAGGGLGNIDECPLSTCLAGAGGIEHRDSITFASVCMVPECSAYDIASDDFIPTIERLLHTVDGGIHSTNTTNKNNTVWIQRQQQLGQEYISLLTRIAEVNKFLNTGWTCGAFIVPWKSWPFGIPFVIIVWLFLMLSLIGACRRKTRTNTILDNASQMRNSERLVDRVGSIISSKPTNNQTHLQKQQHNFTIRAENDIAPHFNEFPNEMTPLTLSDCESIHSTQHPVINPANGCCNDSHCNVGEDHQQDKQGTHLAINDEMKDSSVPNCWNEFWGAFDVRKHCQSLLIAPNDETKFLDGLRVGSLLWIVLGHTMAIISSSGGGYSNPSNFLPPNGITTTILGQLLFSSRLAVDTFFVISGFLVVNVIHGKFPLVQQSTASTSKLNRQTPTERIFPSACQVFLLALKRYITLIPLLVISRLVRIVPLYAACLGFFTSIAPQLGSGPFWHQWIGLLKPCHDYAWTNFLFVNNFVPSNTAVTDTCFYHSWYLAVDMQLFLVAPFLLFWFQCNQRQGLYATAMLFGFSASYTMYISYSRGWSVNTFDGAAIARYDVEGYAKPIIRGKSYFAGMFVAMLLLSQKDNTQREPCIGFSWKNHCMLLLAFIGMIFVTFVTAFGAYDRRPCSYQENPEKDYCGSSWSPLVSILYSGLSRTVWVTCVAIIVYLLSREIRMEKEERQRGQSNLGLPKRNFGYGILASVLSWRCWTPLSKLSFGMYLIHPIVIFVWQLSDREKKVFKLMTFGMDFLSVCVVSYVAALLSAVTIEFPCASLWKLYLDRVKRSRMLKIEDDRQYRGSESNRLARGNENGN